MVRWLSGGGAKNLSTGFEPEPWLALERTLGCELAVRFESADGPEPELVTWAWNERIAETVERGDVASE